MIPALLDHLWQSTLFAAVAGILTLGLRRNEARFRHWLWFAASLKFLVPFSLLVTLGRNLAPAAAPTLIPLSDIQLMQRAAQPFAASSTRAMAFDPAMLLFTAWALGVVALLFFWFQRWRQVQTALRQGAPVAVTAPIPVKAAATALGPGIFGIWRPVLLLPRGIAGHLTPREMDAIIAHELSHLRRRDNLTAAIHTVVETLFWFYPPVWWLGARMAVERERACDENVVQSGNDAAVYAESIMKVCRFYAAPPSPFVSAAAGAGLAGRLEAIMTCPVPEHLGGGRKFLLAAFAALTIAWPLTTGWIQSMAAPIMAIAMPGESRTETALRNYITQLQMGRLVYDATYAHGRVVWAIEPPQSGRLDGNYFQEIFTVREAPGSGMEDSLRRFILSLKQGRANFGDSISVQTTPRQSPFLRPSLRAWGELKSLTFISVDGDGRNVYQANFAHGQSEWHIVPLTAQSPYRAS